MGWKLFATASTDKKIGKIKLVVVDGEVCVRGDAATTLRKHKCDRCSN